MFVTRQWTNGRLALSLDHPPFSSSSASFWPLGTSQEPRTSSPRARRSILVCPGPAMALALSAAGPTVSRGVSFGWSRRDATRIASCRWWRLRLKVRVEARCSMTCSHLPTRAWIGPRHPGGSFRR